MKMRRRVMCMEDSLPENGNYDQCNVSCIICIQNCFF